MFSYIRTVTLCAIAGCLLAAIFSSAGGAVAGALKGLLVGLLIIWGEWRFNHSAPAENGLQRSASPAQTQNL